MTRIEQMLIEFEDEGPILALLMYDYSDVPNIPFLNAYKEFVGAFENLKAVCIEQFNIDIDI